MTNDATDASKVTLSWSDTENETSYTIERQSKHPKNGKWVGSTLLSASEVQIPISDSPGDGVHRYRIQANNPYGSSQYSNWVEVTVSGGSSGGNTGGSKGGGKGKKK